MEKSKSTKTGRVSAEKWSRAGKGKIEWEGSEGNRQGTGKKNTTPKKSEHSDELGQKMKLDRRKPEHGTV
jgi:hypothetical protein